MDPLSEYLARATIEARLAAAYERRPGRQIEIERRAQRRRDRRLAIARWWQRRASRRQDIPARRLAAASATPVPSPSIQLAHLLEAAAHRVAEQGTSSERRLLEAMAEVAAPSAPGAAAALVDVDGTETSRLRAFGVVHSHLLDALGPREHAWLLDLLDGAGGLERSGWVA